MSDSFEHKRLKNEIREAVNQLEGVVLWNNESGVAFHNSGHRVAYGVGKGGADLIGIVNVFIDRGANAYLEVGRWISLEVKTGGGTQSKLQRANQECVEMYGGYYAVVRSVEDAILAVELARDAGT